MPVENKFGTQVPRRCRLADRFVGGFRFTDVLHDDSPGFCPSELPIKVD